MHSASNDFINKSSQPRRHSEHKSPSRHSPDTMIAQKAFNPFPKAAAGLLTAEKAKVGIKLGLYKPEDALSYVRPSERRNLLKDDKNFIGRIAMSSQSAMW